MRQDQDKSNMRNIYLLPTDKTSRLFLNKVNNKLLLDGDTYSNLEKILPSSNYQHLYITSDEEIEDCWVLNTHTNEVYFLKYYYGIQPITKKIILTTDQSLDGVQSIDDKFLEWFVKNPSCEEVEFEKYGYMPEEPCEYKIIFLKQEPKQETLEEAAKKYATNHGMMAHIFPEKEKSFIEGAKWQEQKMYSEKEVRGMLIKFHNEFPERWEIIEWFEQNKKK